jgi:hypothetical protein
MTGFQLDNEIKFHEKSEPKRPPLRFVVKLTNAKRRGFSSISFHLLGKL